MWLLTLTSVLLSIASVFSSTFPYQEFFHVNSSDLNDDGILFMEMTLCSFEPLFYKVCSCNEEQCFKEQTCCIDVFWNSTKYTDLSKYLHDFISKVQSYKPISCLDLVPNLLEPHISEKILMVNVCPRDTNPIIAQRCVHGTTTSGFLPVCGGGLTYQNKYCAICNNINEFSVVNITVECDKHVNISESLDLLHHYGECQFKLAERFLISNSRRCDPSVVNDCKNHNLMICQLCNAYVGGIFSQNKCYRNYHCLLHRHGNNINIWKKPEYCLEAYEAGNPFGYILPQYSTIITFESSKQLQGKQASKCNLDDQVYDIVTRKCITEFFCSFGYERSGSKCVRKRSSTRTLSANVFSGKAGNSDDRISRCLAPYFYLLMEKNFSRIDMKNISHHEIERHLNTGAVIWSNVTHKLVEFYKRPIDIILRKLSIDILHSTTKHYVTSFYGLDFSRSFQQHKFCSSPRQYEWDILNMTMNCSLQVDGQLFSPIDYILNVHSRDNKTDIIICDKFHLHTNCRLRKIKSFSVLQDNSIEDTQAILKPEEYVPLSTGVGVCIQSFIHRSLTKWERIVSGVEGYITVTGCVTSILAYICVILTYSCIKELQTVPGKNIVGLCVMLMISDILILSTIPQTLSYMSCKILAILMHFVALSIQFWSAIIAFDIWSTFYGKSFKRDMRSRRRFYIYCACAVLGPLVVVLISVSMDITKTIDFGYGEHNVCWITMMGPRIVTYFVPTGCLMLFSLTILTYTLIRIYRQTVQSKKRLKKSGGDNTSLARMALKLVVLLGAIELLGFFQATGTSEGVLIFNSIIKLLYSSTRAFRGVFVWLLYVVTDRVFTVYRKVRDRRSYQQSTKLTNVSVARKSHVSNNYKSEADSSFVLDKNIKDAKQV